MAANDPSAPVHCPVMLREVMDALRLEPGGVYADGTLGLGGHALAAADAVRPGGMVYGFDWDAKMLETAKVRLANVEGVAVELFHMPLYDAPAKLEQEGVRPNGVLLDLGLNSAQVDDPSRGFSFSEDGPLDMRMDQSRGEPAAALLNRLSPSQIEQILFDLGDERWARAIAKAIVARRQVNPLRTTFDLVACVLDAVPKGARSKSIHPATKTFQAIRLKVTGELERLGQAISDFSRILARGGTLAVLSYHSGEDRIVKTAFKSLAMAGDGEPEYESIFKKPLQPSPAEVDANRRSRSARLRGLRRSA